MNVLGRVAQLVEQLTFNQWVTGSNPVALTTFPQMDCGSKYNDLANNSLKTLSNLKPSIFGLILIFEVNPRN